MTNKLLHLSMLYILTLKTQLCRISILWILILPIQTFIIFILCIEPNFSSDEDDFVSHSLQLVYSSLCQNLAGTIFLYFAFVISIILMCCFIVFIILKKPINELDRWAVTLHKLIVVSSIFVYIFQTMIFNILWHFKTKMIGFFQQSSETEFLPICIIALFGIIFIVILNCRIRMLGLFNLLFAFLMQSNNQNFSIASSLVGILVSLYIIRTDEENDFLLIKGHNLRKIMHLALTVFFVWKVIDHLTVNKQEAQDTYISYIFLAVLFISALLIGVIQFICTIDRKLPNILQVCECLKIIEENPKETEAQVILSSVLIDQLKTMEKKKSGNIILQELKNKKQIDWTKDEWQMVINMMVKEEQQRNPSLESGINIIKCMLMRKDKQIFEVIQLLKELIENYKDQGFTNLYQILKITLKIQNQYFKKHQTNQFSIAHVVREVDRLNEQFYKDCCKDVDLLFQFWNTVSNYKTRLQNCNEDLMNNKNNEADTIILKHAQNSMQKLISDINLKIKKLENTLQDIQAISTAHREKQALNCLKFLTTYSQEHQEDLSANDKGSDLFSLNTNNRDYSQYLEMLNSKISKASFKLATQLGYKKLEVIGEKVSLLMPQVYESDIEKAILEHHQPVLKIPYYVPVLCSDNSILLKSVSSFLELDYQCGHRILLHFTNSNLDNDPILIYNTYRNMLQHYNKAFIATFKISQSKIDLKIRNNLLNPDEIFKEFQLSEKNVQAKLSESGLETQYNCRMNIQDICDRKSRKFENVRLSLIQKQKGYMILKVMKGYRMKSTIGQSKAVSLRSRIQTFSNLSFVKNDAFKEGKKTETFDDKKNDVIFCKIQNPFESRINLKKVQLGKQKKLTLKFYAIACVFVAVLMVVFQGFAFLLIDLSTKTDMTQENNAIVGSITRYTRLLTAYQLHYKYNIILANKDKVEQIGIDYDNWLKQIGSQIESEINSFQTEYLASISQNQREPLTYTIQFRYFNITTDTSSTNLFDFSQNLLMYGNHDALMFLIKNYKSFTALSNRVVQKERKVFVGVSKFLNMQYIVSGVIFSVSVACMVIFSCLSFKVGWVKANVNEIFKLMDKQKLDSIFTALNSIKKSFMELGEEDGASKQKYPKIMQQENKVQSLEQKTEGDEMEVILGNNLLKSNKTAQAPEQSKIGLFDFKYVGIYGYVFLIVAFVTINVVQFIFVYDKISDESMILNFKIENRYITYSLISQILEAENCQITRSTLGTAQEYTHAAQIALINSKQLPSSYFATYMDDYFKRTSSNLCDNLQNKSLISFDYKTCLQVQRGLFAYGVPKTIEKVSQNLMTINQLGEQFWFHKLDGHKFPRIIDTFSSQQMIIAVNTQSQNTLESYIEHFQKAMVKQSWIIFALGCFFSLAFTIALFFLKKEIYKCSEIAVGYFLIIPKKILLQNQVLDHMRASNLLNKIGGI